MKSQKSDVLRKLSRLPSERSEKKEEGQKMEEVHQPLLASLEQIKESKIESTIMTDPSMGDQKKSIGDGKNE